VINREASATDRPYQRWVSNKVMNLLKQKMTAKKAWDYYPKNHDLYVLAAWVWTELGWDFKKEWLETKARHDAERANPTPKETLVDKLQKWKEEMPADEWVRSTDGTRPKGVINAKASATARPYQRKVSQKVDSLLGKPMTAKKWNDHPKNHDLYVLAAWVWKELGWDFKKEWLETKARHAAGERVSSKAKRSRATTSPAPTAPARAPKKKRTQRPTASASTEEKEDEPMMTDDDMDESDFESSDEFKCDDESSDDDMDE